MDNSLLDVRDINHKYIVVEEDISASEKDARLIVHVSLLSAL